MPQILHFFGKVLIRKIKNDFIKLNKYFSVKNAMNHLIPYINLELYKTIQFAPIQLFKILLTSYY